MIGGAGPILVVKLGGSHAGSALLHAWLTAIGSGTGRVVVVPGGGPFADAVRLAQPAIGYDDSAAHDMALMAMAQFGRALVCLGRRFVLAEDAAAIDTAFVGGRIPVWAPWPMLRGAADIPAGWDVTSDSLALWLATRLRADAVLLAKRRGIAPCDDTRALVAEGVLDPAFPSFLARYSGRVHLAGPDDVPAVLDAARPPGHALASMATA